MSSGMKNKRNKFKKVVSEGGGKRGTLNVHSSTILITSAKRKVSSPAQSEPRQTDLGLSWLAFLATCED